MGEKVQETMTDAEMSGEQELEWAASASAEEVLAALRQLRDQRDELDSKVVGLMGLVRSQSEMDAKLAALRERAERAEGEARRVFSYNEGNSLYRAMRADNASVKHELATARRRIEDFDGWLQAKCAEMIALDGVLSARANLACEILAKSRAALSTSTPKVDHVSPDGVARDEWGYGVDTPEGGAE